MVCSREKASVGRAETARESGMEWRWRAGWGPDHVKDWFLVLESMASP